MNTKELERIANELRILTLKAVYNAQSGHIGGSFSSAEIITVLYFYKLKINPKDPLWEDRDRFILSKGHAAPMLYSALAKRGFFSEEELVNNLRKIGSRFQGHPDMRKTPGVEMTTGSLGQGLSVAIGIALGAKYIDKKSFRVYTLLGDGELNEGQVWEAFMSASKYKLDNLVCICDRNRVQLDGCTEEIMPLEPLRLKIEAFGWEVLEIDGHNIEAIIKALDYAETVKNKPTCIIAYTVKGKGVYFMENTHKWHGRAPNKEEYEEALKELTRGELV
jgi:transketolase